MKNIKINSLSFQGRRENNQDSYLELILDSDVIFLAVADGMGGVAGGKKASELVVKCCEKIVKEKFKEKGPVDLKQVLRKIFFEAQKSIKEEIMKSPELAGMGTTLACLLMKGDKFVWGNIGDSRVYHYSESKLKQITKDHTYIQDFIDENKGQLSQSIIDKYGNYLTRSIDGGTDEPDIFPVDKEYNIIKDGEGFLLCSDGLIIDKANTNFEIFEKIITRTKNLEAATKQLKEFAYINGSSDNITIVLLEKGKIKREKLPLILPTPKQASSKEKKFISPRNHNRILSLIGITATAVLIAIIFIVFKKNDLVNSQIQDYTQNEFHPQNQKTVSGKVMQPQDNNEIKQWSEMPLDSSLLQENKKVTSKNDSSLLKNKSKKNDLVDVPDLIGKSKAEAINYLKKNGFTNVVVKEVAGGKKESGLVIKVSTKSHSKINKDDKIVLIIGT